ncbi:MAG: nucleotidyltransferase [Oscillospiraceae bacterium]|nr:nucleotidyltransferase [Oscillospiraceae bacterium]
MNKPTLVIMAAGMGSRFGGMKQITPVDAQGHIIMDYSIYDAIRAGFGRVVCVIKKEFEEDFEAAIGARLRDHVELVYAYQSLDQLPEGFEIPEGRVKPWGTAHAVWCARHVIQGPFAVLNADDFYGQEAFVAISSFLSEDRAATEHAMVGYRLENTLTENGSVARGVCCADEKGFLKDIVERTKIVKQGDKAAYTEDGETFVELPMDSIVSMNLWGFRREALDGFEAKFRDFLTNTMPSNPLKAEFFLPKIVSDMIEENTGTIRVLSSDARWHGVTYKEDLPSVVAAVQAMKDAGKYPEYLWR